MIFFLGTVPPPKGGVSVYCMRRINEFEEKSVPFKFFDSSRKVSFIRLLFACFKMILSNRAFEVEFNVSNPISVFVFYFLGLSRYTVFFDHNGSRRIVSGTLSKWIFLRFSLALKKIKVVNPSLINNYPIKCRRKIEVFTPFIKPTKWEISEASRGFPEHLAHLLAGKKRNIVLVTAWRPINSCSEPDLYGLFDTLCIFRNIIEHCPEYRFVFMLGCIDESDFCRKLLEKVDDLSHFANFSFITGGVSQLPLLPRTKVLIRLTKTDGDSVSIREALLFGSAVIASDVTQRPSGVIACPAENPSLVEKTLLTLLEDQN